MKEYFKDENLTCKCGCGLNNTTKKHRKRLNMARELAGIPFIVKSGSRCIEHNKNEGGKPTSDHLSGEGTDIKCTNSRDRFRILGAAYAVGFKRIGEAKTFIHLGENKENPQEVHWQY